jgi:hypothetical protein
MIKIYEVRDKNKNLLGLTEATPKRFLEYQDTSDLCLGELTGNTSLFSTEEFPDDMPVSIHEVNDRCPDCGRKKTSVVSFGCKACHFRQLLLDDPEGAL